ncbi:MAG TPA: SdrD B-like domain-containing protein [Chthoniobacteraceae bacterium]|nr:SdrD B-like domain-containing protein [Chthoniobacteraceae bacterium]
MQSGAGETGIGGVTVTVTGTDDRGQAVSFTATSDATGAYSFANLRPSNAAGYTLTETQPAGLLDGKNTVGSQDGSTVNNPATDVIQTVAITPGTTGTGNNFGELPPASLSGFSYNDANNDGVRDAGETLLPGVTITLTGTDDLGNPVSTTAVTDAGGAYAFNNLRPGTYTLTQTQPAGLLDGKETAGTQGSGTVDNLSNSNAISAITLTAGQTGTDNNFADLTASTFGGAVYRDLNNNGVREAGETGIAGASITITGTDDRGVAVNLTVMTDATGAYVFNSLRPGSYTVTEAQPAGFLDGIDTRGTVNGVAAGSVSNDQISGVTLTPGATAANYNFGELSAASLGGTVYRDDNNDGIRQAGELGIGSVMVTLTGTDDLGNAVTLTMQSAADGTYSFTGLRPGTYALTETQPGAFLDGKDTPGSLSGTAAAVPGDTISGIVVGSQQSGTGYNFGELAGSSIAGTAFVDADNDGVLDAGETLLPGVTVTLTGTNDLGQPVTVSATTDASGAYTFSNLRPGTYTVTETQPAGYLDGKDAAGTANGVAASVPGDTISAITLPSNTAATGYTFGELRAASLSGAVFADTNNDGVRDVGEAGIATTVTLTGTDDLGQAVTISVTSDAITGAYDFSGLRPGSYTITETQPAAFLDGRDTLGTAGGTPTNDKVSAITLNEGTTGTGYNFGEVAGSSLAGTVYRDDNNNGVLDGGEARLGGVTIKVTGVDDLGNAVSLTATTDATGAYSFANLRPSNAAGYTITETEPAGYLMGKNTVGSQNGTTTNNPPTSFIQTVQITTGTIGTGNNFGELAPSSLAGATYVDANNNGVLDAGETRLPGVAVTLTGMNDLGQPVSVSTTTDASGAYVFDGLRPGTYTVSETQPAGYLDGQDTAGTALGTAAAVPGDAISAITLASNTPATGYNFGELRGASLAGAVFRDDNNDGAQQAGESGVGGVSVRLRGADDLGNVIDTTITTQPDGTYSFNNLRPGTYRVTETQPAGLLDGKDATGTANGTLANDDVSGIVLHEGDAATGYTFGELGGSRVTGTVFDDRNNDGARGPGEAGIPGATVTLTGTDDLGQPVSVSTTTDPSGNYQFTGLRPGTYTLTETQPAGYLDGKDTAGTTGGTAAAVPGDTISAITLPSNTNADNYLFAELTPAQISGTVYRDDSNDGLHQAGEPGIGGVVVTLSGTEDLGNLVSLSTNTAPDGTYAFANLRPGSYTLTETQPAGYLDFKDTAGTQGGSVAASPGDTITGFTMAPGETGTGNDFGELAPSTISGHVFDDRNNNGTQDAGDAGLQGVPVRLTGTNDMGQFVDLAMMTAPDGSYTFAGLRPGSYTLTETQPAGYLDGTDTAGNLGGTPAAVPGDAITKIDIVSNQTGTGYNFAELAPSSIGGSVFTDLNNDGAQGPGENGIGGVSVTLTGTDDHGQAVNITLPTAPDGTFNFSNLRPGTYTVTETQPAAYADGKDAVGTLNGTPGNDTVAGIVVMPGQTGTGYTFGEQLTSITGTVFVDHNRDGVQDPGDPGLAGVTISLFDNNGNFITSTTTGPGGDYAFATLLAGPYRLVETQPTGYGSSTLNTVDINVTPAGSVVRFGETVSSLSGTVYFDANASGALNAGEPGLSGVTVTLTGTDAAGAAVNRTFTTGADGTYHFDDLLSGNYTVSATQAAGYNDGAETAGNFSGSLATNDAISAIAVPTGQDGAGYNFGELGSPITGVVYRDDSKDGTRDAGEPGLPGVTIQLLDPLTMLPISTTTTGPDGRYTFGNLPPGSYIIRETQPLGYADTTPNDQPVTVAAPGPADVNFGEKLGSFSGKVFQDLDNDGVQGLGEPGIAGVTVTLTGTDALGRPVTRTAMTNATGDYTIDNVLSGTYTLTETQPAGYTDGKDSIGTSNGTPSGTDSTTGIALGAGVAATGYNFGELGATDLTIAKTDGVTETQPGQLITYTVTVSNQGVQDAAGVVVSDQFPTGDLDFVSASNGGVFDPQTGTITWQLGNVTGSGQEVVTLTIQARVKDVVLAGHEKVTNVVTVTDDGTVPDSDPTNNRATDEDRLIAQPDLYVVKTDHLTTAKVGQTTTYTITGGNAGNQVAEGVTVTDLLPPGLRFVSASRGGRLVNGQVVWKLGDLQPGDSFQVTVSVVVEEAAAGKNAHNTAKIDDRFGSFEDRTPRNNRSSDDTSIPALPPPVTPPPVPRVGQQLFYDLFNSGHNVNFRSFDRHDNSDLFARPASVLDVWRDPVLPLAPIYSGEADPGSTLVIELYNANGDRIGEQTVVVDAGGNWLVTFPSSHLKDYPSGVRITEYAAPYASPTTSGRNLRNFFAPALNAGQFAFGGQDSTPLDPRATAPLLSGLNLANPLELGDVKYGSELLPATGAPGGY